MHLQRMKALMSRHWLHSNTLGYPVTMVILRVWGIAHLESKLVRVVAITNVQHSDLNIF